MSIDLSIIKKNSIAIGSLPDLETLKELEKQNYKVVINLCEEAHHRKYINENFVDYLHIPVSDMGLPSMQNLRIFIRNMRFYECCGLPVFIHCHAGLGRSGTMAAIFLLTKGYSANMAISAIRDLRPGAIETKQQEHFIEEAEKFLPILDDYADMSFFNAKKIVEILRKKCPWDREQTHESLIESLLDESFEVVEAIHEKNQDHLKEELGDLFLQPLIQAQVSEDNNQFTIFESIDGLVRKLINRHPHVFSSHSSLSSDGVVNQWSKIKTMEKNRKIYSPVNDIIEISQEAADYGFDWENPYDILRKVEEEVKEVEEAIKNSHSRKIEQEIGDLLFAVFNVTRYLKIDPVKSLEKGRRKFEQRFRYLQILLKKEGKNSKEMDGVELDAYWNRVKAILSIQDEI
jgi:tetrapyrrole methylase family protein / MazG family protein